MATIRHILVAVDFGAHAPRVLDYARSMADAFGASMHLLHVANDPMAGADARARHQADAATRLLALVDEADHKQRHVTLECVVGTPAVEITGYAANHDIDLIVMGTHSHGPSFQMVCGSIAETVIGTAPCPVLTVTDGGAIAQALSFDPPAAAASGS